MIMTTSNPPTAAHEIDCAAVRLIDELAARLEVAGGLARADRGRIVNVVHAMLRRMPVEARREALGG